MVAPRRNGIGFLVLGIALLVWLGSPIPGAAAGRPEAQKAAPSVFVSILPQAYFVERIGAGRVRVEVMVQPGQDPHTFEPTPQQMARLAESKLYFRLGVDFENSLMPRIESGMKALKVVDCREGIRLRPIEGHAHEEEEHTGEEDGQAEEHHEQEGTDPHVWLSVRNAVRIAATMRDALSDLDPAGKAAYDRGYRELVEDLEALDRRIEATLAPVKGKTLFVFHPAFGYFADDYGLKQVAVETGGREPSARQLARLIDEARSIGVRVIFVQPQFSQKSAEAIAAEIAGAVVPIDSLARDYIQNLERMAGAVEQGLR